MSHCANGFTIEAMTSRGRPPMILEVGPMLVEAIRRGHKAKTACELVGISWLTFHRWMQYGEQECDELFQQINPPAYHDGMSRLHGAVYREFYISVKKAKGNWTTERLQQIETAAENPKHWPAAAWLLERNDPEAWALQQKVQVYPGGPAGEGPAAMVDTDQQEKMALAMLKQIELQKKLQLKGRELPS